MLDRLCREMLPSPRGLSIICGVYFALFFPHLRHGLLSYVVSNVGVFVTGGAKRGVVQRGRKILASKSWGRHQRRGYSTLRWRTTSTTTLGSLSPEARSVESFREGEKSLRDIASRPALRGLCSTLAHTTSTTTLLTSAAPRYVVDSTHDERHAGLQ